MQFSQVLGQEHAKAHLLDMHRRNRLAHALLFLGQEGYGGLAMARAFAQYLVCEKVNRSTTVAGPSLFGDSEPAIDTAPPTDSCGICASCKKAAGLVHPDIHFSYPIVNLKRSEKPVSTDVISEWRVFQQEQPYGNCYDWLQYLEAENRQGNISAAECADILRKLSLKSFEAPFKILILWMPEFLGQEGNKLLKIMEEPPNQTLFFLVAESAHQILPTLLSRTQLIRLSPLRDTDIATALHEKKGVPMEQALTLAGMCQGNFHQALHLLQHADENHVAQLREWLNAILRNGPLAQVKWIDEIQKSGREKQKQFLAYFLHIIEQALRLNTGLGPTLTSAEAAPAAGRVVQDFASRLIRICGTPQLEALAELLDKSIYEIERNANGKILFHALTIRIYHIISNKSVILVP